MPTRSDVERLRVANAEVSRLVRADIEDFWSSLNLSRFGAARQALIEYMPVLVQQYGDLGASVAAEWYDEMRSESLSQSLRFRALPAAAPPAEQVVESTKWAIRDLASPTAKGALLGVADRLVKQPGRDTITQNAARERVQWARVPSGRETCAFCLLVASRGFAYTSEQTASKTESGNKYHADCDCVPTPSWKAGDKEIEGYDPDALYGQYVGAGGGPTSGLTAKQILSNMREQLGIR